MTFLALMVWVKGNREDSPQSNQMNASIEWKTSDINESLAGSEKQSEKINDLKARTQQLIDKHLVKEKTTGEEKPVHEIRDTSPKGLIEEADLQRPLASEETQEDTTESVAEVAAPQKPEEPQKPKIALVLHGMGFMPELAEKAANQLSPAITFSFVPYANNVQKHMWEARSRGHEILMAIPMETMNYPQDDPGPQTLLTGLEPQENIKRLHWTIARANGCVGVCNYLGSRFTAVKGELKPILEEVQRQGLMFLDTKSANRSQVSEVSKEIQLTHSESDLTVGLEDSHETFIDKLEKLIDVALATGKAVGVIYVTPHRVEQLIEWEKSLDDDESFTLVPLTEVVTIPELKEGAVAKDIVMETSPLPKTAAQANKNSTAPETIVSELEEENTPTPSEKAGKDHA